MESIYYVMTWLCHRTCVHCYEDRFRPYYGGDLERVVAESRANFAAIIGNLPDSMRFARRNGSTGRGSGEGSEGTRNAGFNAGSLGRGNGTSAGDSE